MRLPKKESKESQWRREEIEISKEEKRRLVNKERKGDWEGKKGRLNESHWGKREREIYILVKEQRKGD